MEKLDDPELAELSEEELSRVGSEINSEYQKARQQAMETQNRQNVGMDAGDIVLQGSVEKSNLKEHLMDSLSKLTDSFNMKKKWHDFQETGFNKEDDKNLKGEVQGYLHDYSKLYRNYEGLTPMEAAQKLASKMSLPLSAREYYGISTELKDEGVPPKKYMKNNEFYKLSDIHNDETRELVQKNIIKNLGLDPNDASTYEKIKDIDVVVPKTSSKLYKQLRNSDKLTEFVANNYEKLSTNSGKRLDDSITHGNPKEFNLYTIFNKSDISAKANSDGSMSILHPDFYDFDYIDPEQEKGIKKLVANINNVALRQQEKGQLAKYSLAVPITLSKEEVEEYIRRYKTRKKLN